MSKRNPQNPAEESTPSEGERRQARVATPGTEFRNLKRHGSASAAELRLFLKELRGKNPAEMLGVVASSNLFQSTVRAAVGTAVLIAVFTLLPFAWSKLVDAQNDPGELARPAAPEQGSPAGERPAAPPKKIIQPNPLADDAEEISDRLGVGETKEAPADVNPLDGANDDLLKDLD